MTDPIEKIFYELEELFVLKFEAESYYEADIDEQIKKLLRDNLAVTEKPIDTETLGV